MAVLEKTYEYKMYRDGVYLGLLPNVTSEFSYTQDLNSAFAQTSIDVGLTPDTAPQEVEPLLDEQGNTLLDETGEPLYEEARPPIFGDAGDALVRNGNDIKVYEYSDENPNGLLVFNGFVETWSANFGKDNKLNILCLSNGADTSDYVVLTGGFTSRIEQNSENNYTTIYEEAIGASEVTLMYAQTFTPGVDFSLGKVRIWLQWNPSGGIEAHGLILRLHSGTPSGAPSSNTPIATVTIDDQNDAAHWADFILATPQDLAAGQTYYFSIQAIGTADQDAEYNIHYDDTNPFTGGNGYTSFADGAWFAGMDIDNPADMKFQVYSSNSEILSEFSSQDPADILTAVIDNYVAQGGSINYAVGSVDATSLSVTYSFKLATVLEALQKCLDLAPSDWYWYIDAGSNILYFKQTATTADHLFVLGRHIENLDLVASAENIKNIVYFSGGDTGGGENLFSLYTNQDSIDATGRRRLDRVSDNRVTIQATADTIADNILDEFASDEYQSIVFILDGTYDISSINLGDTVGFAGFGTFVDDLVLRVASKTVHPDRVELKIGKLPMRQNDHVAQTLQDLNKLQTVDNPDVPT